MLALEALGNHGGMAALNKILGWCENWQRRRCHCNSDCHFYAHSNIWYPKRHLLGIFIQLKGLPLIVVDLYLDSQCLPEAQYHDVVADFLMYVSVICEGLSLVTPNPSWLCHLLQRTLPPPGSPDPTHKPSMSPRHPSTSSCTLSDLQPGQNTVGQK